MTKVHSKFNVAIDDLKSTLKRSSLWLHLGWLDIQQRYRGSILGPFWITLSMIIFVLALSIVYSRLFHQDVKSFLPFLTAGMLIWTFISTVLIESADVFVNAKSLIDNIKLPYLVFMLRLIWRNNIIFFHNLVVFIAIALILHTKISFNSLFFFPGFFLVSLLMTSVGLVIALIGTRFRDIPPVITSLVMVVFFVSPVTWRADMIGTHSLIIKLNPVYYIMDLARAPLLGEQPQLTSWGVCLFLTIICFGISFSLFSKYRSRIPFWI
jgi:lipopolysaccharide transport system permease protein